MEAADYPKQSRDCQINHSDAATVHAVWRSPLPLLPGARVTGYCYYAEEN